MRRSSEKLGVGQKWRCHSRENQGRQAKGIVCRMATRAYCMMKKMAVVSRWMSETYWKRR